MKAREFDAKFDAGEDVVGVLDLSHARRTNQETRRVNVDFPRWMIQQLDPEARRIGVSRQAIIKTWLWERLQQALPSN